MPATVMIDNPTPICYAGYTTATSTPITDGFTTRPQPNRLVRPITGAALATAETSDGMEMRAAVTEEGVAVTVTAEMVVEMVAVMAETGEMGENED